MTEEEIVELISGYTCNLHIEASANAGKRLWGVWYRGDLVIQPTDHKTAQEMRLRMIACDICDGFAKGQQHEI